MINLVKSILMKVINNSFDFDSKGWRINAGELPTPERGVYPYHYIHDKLFESLDGKYACLFYTINEYRMGAQAGLIAIFKNKVNPNLIVNPKDQWFDYQGNSSITFFDSFIFVRKLAYNKDEKLSGTPFVVFNMTKKTFGFVDFDWSSIYYSPVKVSDTFFKFHLDAPEELKHSTITRTNEQFDISSIKYYPFDKVNNLMELYFDEKKSRIEKGI